jgi:predicted GH43/DUF377 family glycosyl hydrolase
MDKCNDHPLLDGLRTPHKSNRLVIAPSYRKGDFDSHLCDCPFPFRHAGRFWMTYVGHDGIGYRTGLASSDDLVHWTKEGLILDRGPKGSPTEFNAALTCILRDNELMGSGELRKTRDRPHPAGMRSVPSFLGTYHAYPAAGYEAGPACISLCWSDDLRHWELDEPILRAEDGAAWERGGLYKSWLTEHAGRYYLFYNAKDRPDWPWREQTGVAWSDDLKRWTRCAGNPVLRNGPAGAIDELFASDPVVLRLDGRWIMFYFGNAADGHARDGAAVSDDLIHWTKLNDSKPLLDVGPAGSIDSTHAHKPGVIASGGVLYHFYCAVRPAKAGETGEIETPEVRGIAVATSAQVGRAT